MRPNILASLVLAACAATADSPEVLYLEAGGYECGAEEGLGCGLALAPKLEALDAVEGVRESRVSWDGRSFRVELEPNAEADRVAEEVSALLGADTSPLAARGDSSLQEWFSSEGTIALSLHEANVLAAEFGAGIKSAAGLDDASAREIEAVLRDEFIGAFERAHAAGGGVHRLWDQVPEARASFESRIRILLTEDEREKISAFLDSELGT